MSTKPAALRLAADLETPGRSFSCGAVADMLRAQAAEIERLAAERDALRAALQRIVDWDAGGLALTEDHAAQARAALARKGE